MIDLREDNYILINSLNSSCSTKSGHKKSTIGEISNYIVKIAIDDDIQENNETYVIKFYNATMKINNRLYRNFASQSFEDPPSVLQLSPEEKKNTTICYR